MKITEIIGHFIGVVGVILFFISYQVKNKTTLLIIQSIATAFICLQYLLIGAYSGCGLNIVCIIRNITLFMCAKKGVKAVWIPVFLSFLMPVACAFTWEGAISLFILAGLMINTVCMGVCSQQNLRKSIVLTSSLILIYNILKGSYAGAMNESISIVSAIIGVIRYSGKSSEH